MKSGWASPLYVLNVAVQAIFDLCAPIALGFFGARLLTEKAGAGGWIYALFITGGAVIGIFSMCRQILRSMAALEQTERQADRSKHETDDTEHDR